MDSYMIDVGYVDPVDLDEREYALAEREGKRLNDVLCLDCPDPGLCAAEGECPREASC